MDSLRNEIINAQDSRSDLLKWKLLLVAGLGTAGLGLGSFAKEGNAESIFYPELLLCLIPFVCLYVDFLCRHLNLRMSVIGQFLRYDPTDETCRHYEKFCSEMAKKDIFS